MARDLEQYICPGCNKTVVRQRTDDGHILAHPLPACDEFVNTSADSFFAKLKLAQN
jgi:hypothetical protein